MKSSAMARSRRSVFGRAVLFAIVVAMFGAGPSAARADALTFVLRIENARVPADMRLIRVKQGDVVTLQISADRRTIVHLHGYDIEKTVKPGAVTELTFTARATGRFPLAPHTADQGGAHSHGEALVTIEVYPR